MRYFALLGVVLSASPLWPAERTVCFHLQFADERYNCAEPAEGGRGDLLMRGARAARTSTVVWSHPRRWEATKITRPKPVIWVSTAGDLEGPEVGFGDVRPLLTEAILF